jgi:transcriptional regulator with XRE-family HTH domain
MGKDKADKRAETRADKRAAAAKKPAHTAASVVGSLGEYLKEQRLASRLSLRQLADQVGVSNPYLSQIERGLRRPSAEVLNQLAKALRISAEQLYVQAGIVHPDASAAGSVELAILGDHQLTERQKQSLLDVYSSFLALNQATSLAPEGGDEVSS